MALPRRHPRRDDRDAILASLDTPSAFEMVFDRHYEAVHRYAQRRCGRNADEIASETFLVAYRNRAKWVDRQQGARPWLLGIATNLIRETVRHDASWVRASATVTPRPDSSGWEDELAARLDADSQARAVAEALSTLSADDRETFLLCVLGDLTYDEVATALDVPPGTVASRISRARRRLSDRVTQSPRLSHPSEVSPHG